MLFSFDKFDRYEIPVFTLCNPNFAELVVFEPNDTSVELRFAEISNLSFSVNQDSPAYELLSKNRLVNMAGFGDWVVVGTSTESDGATEIKTVNCASYEYVLQLRNVDMAAGTYKFYDPVLPDNTLLGKIKQRLPSWTIANVSVDLLNKYRTFERPDTDIYSFLMNEVAEAYECVFIFDIQNHTINAYTTQDIVQETDIVFTWDNLMKSVTIAETDDAVVTAMDVYGSGDFTIANVNPLGTPTIYRFDHFADQMTPSLWEKVAAWQTEVDEAIVGGEYAQLLAQKKTYNADVLRLEAEVAEATVWLDSGRQVQDVSTPYTLDTPTQSAVTQIKTWIDGMTAAERKEIVLSATSYAPIEFDSPPSDIADIVSTVTPELGGIAEALVNIYLCELVIDEIRTTEIAALTTAISGIDVQLNGIHTELSLDEYFTAEELIELDKFLFGEIYTNEYYVIGENFTYEDVADLAQELYQQGKEALLRASQPNYTFELSAVNYLFLKEYQHYIAQTALGCTVNAEIADGEWVTPLLVEIDFSFDKPDDFSMVWGNRYRLQTPEYVWADLMAETSRTNSSIAANFSDMIKAAEKTDEFESFMNGTLDAARNAIVAGNNQGIVIDQHGLLARRFIDATGEYDPRQIKIINNLIAMTDDNWENCVTAIGELDVNGTKLWGIAAQLLAGDMIVGNQLSIINESGTFAVDANGLSYSQTYQNGSADAGRITMSPEYGFHIQSYDGSQWVDKIALNPDGNIVITGALTSVSGIGGWANEHEEGLRRVRAGYMCLAGVEYYSDESLSGEPVGTVSSKEYVVEYGSSVCSIDVIDADGMINTYYVATSDTTPYCSYGTPYYTTSSLTVMEGLTPEDLPVTMVGTTATINIDGTTYYIDSGSKGVANFAQLGGDYYAFSAGTGEDVNSPVFSVDYNGNLVANSGAFRGTIAASSGSLGGISSSGNETTIVGNLKVSGRISGALAGTIGPTNAGITGSGLVTSNGSNFGIMQYSTIHVESEDGSFSGNLLLYGTPSYNPGGGGSGGVTYNLIKKNNPNQNVYIRADHYSGATSYGRMSDDVWYAVNGSYGSTWYQVYATVSVSGSSSSPSMVTTVIELSSPGWVNLDPSLSTVSYVTGVPQGW